MGELLKILNSDPGFFVGMAAILFAGSLLPGRMKWYFMTAGVAVLGYRIFQLVWANERTKELDKTRIALNQELENLRQATEKLRAREKELNDELAGIKAQRDSLALEFEQWQKSKEAMGEELDRRLREVEEMNAQWRAKREYRDEVQRMLDSAARMESQTKEALGGM